MLLLKQGLFTLIAIALRPFRTKPRKPLILLYGHQFSGNLKALYLEWKDNFHDDLELRYLSLDPDQSDDLQSAGIEVLRCNRLTDMMALSQASAMVTDHGLHTMGPLVRLTSIRFIDVWHGIPFKGFVPDDFRLQHRYDEVWVSSPGLKRIYVGQFGFESRRVRALGYARADQLFRGAAHHAESAPGLTSKDSKVVLYAPTWRQDDAGRELFPFNADGDSFIHRLAAICEANGAVLAIRSHLNSNIEPTEHGNVLFCSQQDYPDTESVLLQSDILICDWSSIAFDFLALRRPTLFLDVPPPFKNGFSLDAAHRFGDVVSSMDELENSVRTYLEDPSFYQNQFGPKQEQEIEFSYGEYGDDQSSRRQLQRLLDIVK